MMKSGNRRPLLAVALTVVSGTLLAAAPAGRYAVSDEVVHDRRTDLTWQRVDESPLLTHAQAIAYCESATFGDRDGWRLPTLKELQTLIDARAASPALDADAFPDARAEAYWTSTVFAGDENKVWMLHVGKGVPQAALRSDTIHVRCVR